MGDQPGYVTPAGWYVDPGTGTRLRWWSGLDWTEHFAPMTEHRPEPTSRPGGEPFDGRSAGADARSDSGTDESAPPLSRRERRALEEEAAGTQALPPPVTRIAPITSYAWDREADRSESRPSAYVPMAAPEEATLYRDIPSRWSTASVWTIAFMPWIAGVTAAASLVLAWWGSAWWLQLGALALPFLLTLAAAQRDVKRLRSWRHRTVAHWAWSLLGSVAYLIARTVVLRRHAGLGSAPMWVGLANSLLVCGATVWLVGAAATNLAGFHAAMADDLGAALEPSYGVVQVECPADLEALSFACNVTDAGGVTRSVWVELNAADGSYTYSVAE
ncbi:DUF2510 domain-containing protein [Cryobacterium sp. N22]|uniref:DUF2510 domain-containing protein n=1 Tax=Cryobacterium sp. N22 TaxID=2048290 RepID=UPI000CE33B1E|nr:DUF2510 domain-containing protein [Cryobacterium sp. N22]